MNKTMQTDLPEPEEAVAKQILALRHHTVPRQSHEDNDARHVNCSCLSEGGRDRQ